jgi:thioredoxin 1
LLLNERATVQRRTLAWSALAAVAAALGLGAVLVHFAEPAAPVAASAAAPAEPAADAVQRALAAGKPTVVEFGANACASCREMKPVLAALRREHGERIEVVEVDLIAQKHEADYIRRYRIALMPTQVFFDARGRETGRNMGRISGAEILARLDGSAR